MYSGTRVWFAFIGDGPNRFGHTRCGYGLQSENLQHAQALSFGILIRSYGICAARAGYSQSRPPQWAELGRLIVTPF